MLNNNAYHRKDGRWEVRIYFFDKGQKKRSYRSFYGKTKETAELKAAAFIEPVKNEVITEMTVKELAEEYLTIKAPLLKESTA